MEDITRRFDEDVVIADECRQCPHLSGLGKQYDQFSYMHQRIVDDHFDGAIPKILIQESVQDGMPLEMAVEMYLGDPETVNEAVLATIDEYTEQRDAAASLAQKMIDACPGALQMRGVKAGRQVTAIVCMSDILEMIVVPDGVEPVRVERRDIDD